MLSSEKEVKNASDKNYQQESSCQFCQATGLLPGLEPQDLPDLTASINVWSVSD